MAVLDLGKVVPEKGVDYFTESDVNQIVDDVVDEITIPTKVSELENDSEFIDKTVNNLTHYTLATNTGSLIELSINNSTYVMTMNLKNANGTVISTGTVDLPLESVVVNGSYDSVNKKIVLTLQGGSTIDVPVGDLINGLQSEITSSNKLSSDLVDDTNQANKFATTSEKNAWNAKYDKPSGGIPSSDLSSAVQTSLGKADTAIQDVSDKQDTLVSGTNIKSINNESILGSGNLTISGGQKLPTIITYNDTSATTVSAMNEWLSNCDFANRQLAEVYAFNSTGILRWQLVGVNRLDITSTTTGSLQLYFTQLTIGANTQNSNMSTVLLNLTLTNGEVTSLYWTNKSEGKTLLTSSINQDISAKFTFSSNLPESSLVPSNDNQLANKKYVDDAVAGGGGGGQTIQYETMPTPSASNEGDVIQFVGTTTSDYINGYYYQCISDGQAIPSYSWARHDTQPSRYIIDGNSVIYYVKAGSYNINTTSTVSQVNVTLPYAEVKEAIELAQKNNKRLSLHIIDYGDFNSIMFIGSAVPPTSSTTYELFGKTISGDGNGWLTKLMIAYTYSSSEVTVSSIKRVGYAQKSIGITNSISYDPSYDSYNPATAKYAESMTLPIAPRYSKTTAYAVGDYVTQYNKLYVCNTAIPSGENWNASHWTETTVVSIIGNLETALSNITTGNGV